MNSESKEFYDSAYDSLKDGESATYIQETSGSYINDEWVTGSYNFV